MKLLFDSSVWIEHLRHGALDDVIPALRGSLALWVDSVVAAELVGGCRTTKERREVSRLLAPFERAHRVAAPTHSDFQRAALAISRLRARGRTLASPGGALLDGVIAAVAVRIGATVVTANARDFHLLASEMPATVEDFPAFVSRIAH